MYCINCGECDSLEDTGKVLFYEYGAYNEDTKSYESEGELSVLACTACQHEIIDVSNQIGTM